MSSAEQSVYATRYASLDDLADRIDRDRREPDKVLTYAYQLRGIARELRDVAEWAEKPEGDAWIRLSQALPLLRSIAGGEHS